MFENHSSSGDCVTIQSRSPSGFKKMPKEVQHEWFHLFIFEEFILIRNTLNLSDSTCQYNKTKTKNFLCEKMAHEIMVLIQGARQSEHEQKIYIYKVWTLKGISDYSFINWVLSQKLQSISILKI